MANAYVWPLEHMGGERGRKEWFGNTDAISEDMSRAGGSAGCGGKE